MAQQSAHFALYTVNNTSVGISGDGIPGPDTVVSQSSLPDLINLLNQVPALGTKTWVNSGIFGAQCDGVNANVQYVPGVGTLLSVYQPWAGELSSLLSAYVPEMPVSSKPLDDAGVAALVADSSSATATQLSATIVASVADRQLAQPAYHLDAYANFFAGPWVAAQTNVSTALTAAAASAATTLAVTDGSAIPNGTVLVTDAGSAKQQQYTVTAGGGTNTLTVAPSVTSALASGATVSPVWTNENHLTPDGYTAYSYWMLHWKKPDGTNLFTDPGSKPIVWLGDSWSVYGTAQWTAQVAAMFPTATAVVAGVVGNSSDMLIARWSDVPTNAAYVIFNEPGTNDIAHGNTRNVMAANLETLVALIRSIGAIPVYTGMVPLFNYPQESALEAVFLRQQMADPVQFPAVPLSTLDARYVPSRVPEPGSVLLGAGTAWLNTSGTRNVAVGFQALHSNTAGGSNCALGYNTLFSNTTGSNNTGFGYGSLQNNVTGLNNTALGYGALQAHTGNYSTAAGTNALNASTANFNTAFGYAAGTSPAGVAANKTVGGTRVTAVGYAAGASGSGDPAQYTAVGANAVAGINGTALGVATSASGTGSVAIGIDSAGTGASASVTNEIGLGTALHTTRIAGFLRLDKGQTTVGAAGAASALPVTPAKFLSVKDSTGTEYVFPVYAKA